MQLGMVVRDIDAATRFWSEHVGVGPWILIEDAIEGRRFVHRGRDTNVETSLAFSYAGETQLELIAQANDAPSPYAEFLERGQEGVHHLGFWPDDCPGACKALERAGFEELCAVYGHDGTKGARYYLSPAAVGIMFEVAPMTPPRRAYMSAVERLVSSWDGSRPVRRFENRASFLASDDFAAASAGSPDG